MTSMTLPPLDLGRDDDGPIFLSLVADCAAHDAMTWAASHCGSCGRVVKKRTDGSPVRHKDQPGGEWCVGGAA